MIDLDEATRALRDDADGSSLAAPQTRARIMRSLHERSHTRRLRWGFGVPLAVVFAGSTAFAGARGALGETVQHAVSSVRAFFVPEAEPSAATGAARKGASGALQPAPPPLAEPPLVTPPPLADAPPQTDPPPQAPLEQTTKVPPEPPPQASSATPPLEDPATAAALRLYRSAHEAQFVKFDCVAALAGYDAYLKAAPGDRLVPEARYNRALCLVHLGRRDDAKGALTPFAEGRYGDFRKREARELLEALDR